MLNIVSAWCSLFCFYVLQLWNLKFWHMSLITRKLVFGVCDQVRLKPACQATEARWRLEISDIETRGIILSRQRTTKALIRLRGCAGWSAPLLFAYCINRFSHDVAHMERHNAKIKQANIEIWTSRLPLLNNTIHPYLLWSGWFMPYHLFTKHKPQQCKQTMKHFKHPQKPKPHSLTVCLFLTIWDNLFFFNF